MRIQFLWFAQSSSKLVSLTSIFFRVKERDRGTKEIIKSRRKSRTLPHLKAMERTTAPRSWWRVFVFWDIIEIWRKNIEMWEIPWNVPWLKYHFQPWDTAETIAKISGNKWNCPCMQNCSFEDTKCASRCAKKCKSERNQDADTGPKSKGEDFSIQVLLKSLFAMPWNIIEIWKMVLSDALAVHSRFQGSRYQFAGFKCIQLVRCCKVLTLFKHLTFSWHWWNCWNCW